jgi:hypothetical protein
MVEEVAPGGETTFPAARMLLSRLDGIECRKWMAHLAMVCVSGGARNGPSPIITGPRNNSEGLVPKDRRPLDHYRRQFIAADGLPLVVSWVVWGPKSPR